MYQSLLVAIDGSQQSEKALMLACQLAKNDNALLHIMHAPERLQHPAMMTWGLGSVPLQNDNGQLDTTGNQILQRALLEVRELGVTQVQSHLVRGEPAHAIIQQAELLGVDVIVLGCRGLGNLEGMAMGSISHKVNHSAKCGVITIR